MIIELISHYGTEAGLLFRLLADLMLLLFCIPLQIREATVKNGLRTLRFQLLAFGLILFITNNITIFFLFDVLGKDQPFINAALQMLNGFAFLLLAVIGFQIYHTQYTEESREHHERIAEMEHKKHKV